MSLSYNRIAGQSVERLAALSDGVFAVAMTLLALDLRSPAVDAIHGEQDLWRALVALSPRLIMFMMSFLTLGIFGLASRRSSTTSPDRTGLSPGCTCCFCSVCMTPFSTSLLAEFTAIERRILTGQGLYAFGVLLCVISAY